jgi:methyl-accepting chemotaxis protein
VGAEGIFRATFVRESKRPEVPMSNDAETQTPIHRRPPFHKRQYIVDKPFQYRLIGVLLAIWLANSAFFSIVLYFFYEGHLTHFYELIPKPGMAPLVSPDVLVGLAVVFVLVFGVITLFTLGLYLSNQIAGPLFRMKKSFQRVARGDLGFTLQFRQGDFMRDVPGIFNSMLEGMRQRAEAEIAILRAIESSGEVAGAQRLARQLREQREAALGIQSDGSRAASEQEPVSVAVH